jgi:MoxR-like ATPase
MPNRWNKISESPTRTGTGASRPGLTAEDLFRPPHLNNEVALDEKLRRVYYWLVNRAVISPFYDIEFSLGAPVTFPLGDAGAELHLPTDQSYSSNVLLPLLTTAVGGKCLLVGGPGRGKTTLAVLMGVLAGTAPADVRRSVQQGQPQLTVGDLVGIPLPRDLVNAASLPEITIAWRSWLTRPVKIIDEYNRIPTKTQSALLTMVAEGYVESYDQMLQTAPESGVESWFFTANDDSGGGTFPVIQALKDRVDVTVAALGFNSRFFDELITRVEAGEKPEDHVPEELVFTPAEQHALAAAIRAVPVPREVRRQLEFFASQFEFVQHGGRRFEYRTKDTVMTSGGRVGEVIDSNTGADLQIDLGAQTTNSLSARALQSLITYSKAMAYFRGVQVVGLDDVAAVLPFSLRGKLLPNELHPRFETGADRELATDPISWLADLFEQSRRQFLSLGLAMNDPIGELLATFSEGLDGVSQVEGSRRLTAIESQIQVISKQKKLYGRHFDDLVALKYLHQRYTNYLQWLEGRPR